MQGLSLPPHNHYIPTDFTLRSASGDASTSAPRAAALKEAAAALMKGMSGKAEQVRCNARPVSAVCLEIHGMPALARYSCNQAWNAIVCMHLQD